MNDSHRHIAQIFVATDLSQKLRSTLEFGAVVAIVMLLTVLAVRNYETFVVRSQLSEALTLTSTVKAEMVAFRAYHGRWPRTETEFHDPTMRQESSIGKFVDHIALGEGGSLSAVFGNKNAASALSGRQLTIRPMLVSSSPGSPVFWACAKYNAPVGFTASGPDETDIEISNLPFACRGH